MNLKEVQRFHIPCEEWQSPRSLLWDGDDLVDQVGGTSARASIVGCAKPTRCQPPPTPRELLHHRAGDIDGTVADPRPRPPRDAPFTDLVAV